MTARLHHTELPRKFSEVSRVAVNMGHFRVTVAAADLSKCPNGAIYWTAGCSNFQQWESVQNPEPALFWSKSWSWSVKITLDFKMKYILALLRESGGFPDVFLSFWRNTVSPTKEHLVLELVKVCFHAANSAGFATPCYTTSKWRWCLPHLISAIAWGITASKPNLNKLPHTGWFWSKPNQALLKSRQKSMELL